MAGEVFWQRCSEVPAARDTRLLAKMTNRLDTRYNTCMQTRINNAIRECLDRCYVHANPMACLAEYAAKLVTEHEWTQADANLVAAKAMRMLKIMLEPTE